MEPGGIVMGTTVEETPQQSLISKIFTGSVPVLSNVKRLTKHPAFALHNPNRVSALIGAFAANPLGFHAADGSGYRFIGEIVVKLDKLNPLAAARLAKIFTRWRDFEPRRQKLMKEEIGRLASHKGLSVNSREIVERCLGGKG